MPAREPLLLARRRHRARVEIVPLIDVIFFLLATFVLVAMAKNRIVSLPLNLPDNDDSTAGVLTLRVASGSTVHWDQEVITHGELALRLDHLRCTDPDRHIMLSGDASALVGDATPVLDALRRADFKQVTVDTRPIARR